MPKLDFFYRAVDPKCVHKPYQPAHALTWCAGQRRTLSLSYDGWHCRQCMGTPLRLAGLPPSPMFISRLTRTFNERVNPAPAASERH